MGAGEGLFRNRRYARIWLVGLLTALVRWLEMLALGLWALDETGSPALVAALVILRFLPMALAGPALGGLADRAEPVRLLRLALLLVLLVSLAMWALFIAGLATYPMVALAAFASGIFWASDLPIRRKIVGEAVEPARLAQAMALDGATSNGMRMAGPLFGGLLYGAAGAEGIYALAACAYAAAFIVALTLAREPAAETARDASEGGALAALAHAWASPDARRILLVTVAFNLWGFPYLAMVPVIGRESLGLSPGVVGAITSIEGLFALLGAFAVARFARPSGWRRLYVGATGLLFLVIFAMGALTSLPALVIGLALGGACTSAFGAMQATLIYQVAPPSMRGRYLGLMTLAIGAGALGFLNVGLTAELVGAERALILLGLEGLIPLLLIARGWRALRSGPPGSGA